MEKPNNYKILIVDDEEPIRLLISQILEHEGYKCDTAPGVDEALVLLDEGRFSLVISDINMPGKSGLDLLNHIVRTDEDIAVVMVTAVGDREVAVRTLEMGAYGYIIKPFDRNELLISFENALRRRDLEINNRHYSEELEVLVSERTKELLKAEREIRSSREETIYRLAKAAEFRDNETAQHTIRMGHYCAILARQAGFPDEFCERIRVSSPLHDVGKIGVPDTILLKPGKLTTEEFEVIKGHPDIGFRILDGSHADLLKLGASIAHTHHEKFDGSGYPQGLVGDNIPIEGRIAAVCDVFDALTSDRVYKDAMPVETALDILREGRGSHFDPALIDSFLDCVGDILVVKSKFADGQSS